MSAKEIVVVRGGGDLATGVIQAFFRSGYSVLVLETEKPTAIRRSVAVCEAIYKGTSRVEDINCCRIEDAKQAEECWRRNQVPILVDKTGASIEVFSPVCVIDAILAKKNTGTTRSMAPVTIGLGPGFTAGQDVDIVIETMRGHDLGRLLWEGTAFPNTGIPGEIGGKSEQRVIHAPVAGTIKNLVQIGDVVSKGQAILQIEQEAVMAPFTGLLRGLLCEGLQVPKGMKIADIDPRMDVDWRTISDKARCLGGAALQAYLYQTNQLK